MKEIYDMNKLELELESVSFLNESPTIGIGIGLIALYASVVAGLGYYYKKKISKQLKDNKTNTKPKRIKLPTRDQVIDGFNKAYNIDKSFFNLVEKDYKDKREVYNDMEADAKFIANKIASSNIFKVNCDEAMKSLPDEKINKDIIDIDEGVNGYDESMQILDTDQDVITAMNWIVYDIAEILEIKYSDYLGYIDTGDGDEGTIYYSINIK